MTEAKEKKENTVNTAPEKNPEDNGVEVSLGSLVIGAISIAALGLGVWNFMKTNEKPVHIVDLAGISMTYQEQAKNQGLQNGISDQQRAAILQNYQAKMNTLQQVIEEKVIQCGCNIFVKSALVGRNTEVVDITADIMKELDKRIPATAVVVIVAGLQGSVFGYLILKKLGIKQQEAVGLSVGAVSHALGTVSCMEADPKAGSYSSISLVLCGIMSSILAPLVFHVIRLFL